MDKKFIPSLIIFFKGFVITALGIVFHFMKPETSIPLIVIGLSLIFVSFIVLLIMHLIESKKK